MRLHVYFKLATNAYVQAFLAGSQCRPSYTSLPLWTQLPWEKIAKRPIDHIPDLYLSHVSLDHRIKGLARLSSDEGRSDEIMRLISTSWETDRQMEELYQTLSSRIWFSRTDYAGRYLRSICDIDTHLEFCATFADFDTAMIASWLWALQASLWSKMVYLYDLLAMKHNQDVATGTANTLLDDLTPNVPQLTYQTNWIDRVYRLLASVPFYLQPRYQITSPLIIATPLGLAYRDLLSQPQFEAEKQAIASVLNVLTDGMMAYRRSLMANTVDTV